MGFDLFKLNLLQGGVFRQARYLLSTPQRALSCVLLSEAGTGSKHLLPMDTGFVKSDKERWAWEVIHPLKFEIYVDGKPSGLDPVLLLSERSYKPLDPLKRFSDKDWANLSSLKEIAKSAHARTCASVNEQKEDATTMQSLIVTGSFVLMGLMIVAKVILEKVGQ